MEKEKILLHHIELLVEDAWILITSDWLLDCSFDRVFDDDTILLKLWLLNRSNSFRSMKINIVKSKETFKEFLKLHDDNEEYGFDVNEHVHICINVIKYLRYFFKKLITHHHE